MANLKGKSALAHQSERINISASEDRYGFSAIAEKLAPAIIEVAKEEGTIIGLEGRWGAGKTTMMDFIKAEIINAKDSRTHFLAINPWLGGDAESLVESLTTPIGQLLEDAERRRPSVKRSWFKKLFEQSEIKRTVKRYGAKTARSVSLVAQLAGRYAGPFLIAADAVEVTADLVDHSIRQPTLTEVKSYISEKMRRLDLRVIVLIDDLDRLEPKEVAEVMRLVRSVADFEHVTYLLCYDREVLAHAIRKGLKVADGDAYLQKIVQLSFAIPLPEPFDLRESFFDTALAIYEELHGPTDDEFRRELKKAIDRWGVKLSTPREVNLALNRIRLIYPPVSEVVYFPDVCALNLIKITFPALHSWMEQYLNDFSVIVRGMGQVSSSEKERMGRELLALLPSDKYDTGFSAFGLSELVPGVSKGDTPETCVFQSLNDSRGRKTIRAKRLGSPFSYRYYFALSSPKMVLSDEQWNELKKDLSTVAGTALQSVTDRIVGYAESKSYTGQNWFQHILGRLSADYVQELDATTLSGFAVSIANAADRVIALNPKEAQLSHLDLEINEAIGNILRRLRTVSPEKFWSTSEEIVRDGSSLNWIVGNFVRSELFDHGKVGERARSEALWLFTEDQLTKIASMAAARIKSPKAKEDLVSLPDIGSYLFGCANLTSQEEVMGWLQPIIAEDSNFLAVLEGMRSWSISDIVRWPLQRKSLEVFFDAAETKSRLSNIAQTKPELKETAEDLLEAIAMGDGKD